MAEADFSHHRRTRKSRDVAATLPGQYTVSHAIRRRRHAAFRARPPASNEFLDNAHNASHAMHDAASHATALQLFVYHTVPLTYFRRKNRLSDTRSRRRNFISLITTPLSLFKHAACLLISRRSHSCHYPVSAITASRRCTRYDASRRKARARRLC